MTMARASFVTPANHLQFVDILQCVVVEWIVAALRPLRQPGGGKGKGALIRGLVYHSIGKTIPNPIVRHV
ncbi:hypothetical protein GCM10023156_64410 [Novipirellula rosea]|uniref:Uncharacterized protein n=1 Tax=Novipirellula rosea TaxID=1031540 RepID=A0ABP8NQF3_9BACT